MKFAIFLLFQWLTVEASASCVVTAYARGFNYTAIPMCMYVSDACFDIVYLRVPTLAGINAAANYCNGVQDDCFRRAMANGASVEDSVGYCRPK